MLKQCRSTFGNVVLVDDLVGLCWKGL